MSRASFMIFYLIWTSNPQLEVVYSAVYSGLFLSTDRIRTVQEKTQYASMADHANDFFISPF